MRHLNYKRIIYEFPKRGQFYCFRNFLISIMPEYRFFKMIDKEKKDTFLKIGNSWNYMVSSQIFFGECNGKKNLKIINLKIEHCKLGKW